MRYVIHALGPTDTIFYHFNTIIIQTPRAANKSTQCSTSIVSLREEDHHDQCDSRAAPHGGIVFSEGIDTSCPHREQQISL